MKAVIPQLRLLTVPVDQHAQLSKYLTNSEKLFLAKSLMYKDENSAAKEGSSRLNLSTSSRSGPKSQKFKLGFIAKDFIKTDWEMIYRQWLGANAK